MRVINLQHARPTPYIFDGVAEGGCYFLVPITLRGWIHHAFNYNHGHQLVFDARLTHSVLMKDAMTGETKVELINVAANELIPERP